MTKYLKTSFPPAQTKTLFRRCLTSCLGEISKLPETRRTDEFLSQNFDFRTIDILKEYIANLELKVSHDDLLEIIIDDGFALEGYSINTLIKLLEYGDLELKAPKIMTTFLEMGITKLKDELGGI